MQLGTNRFALVDGDTVFDTEKPNGKGPKKSFTTAETGGCSCEQIIAAASSLAAVARRRRPGACPASPGQAPLIP